MVMYTININLYITLHSVQFLLANHNPPVLGCCSLRLELDAACADYLYLYSHVLHQLAGYGTMLASCLVHAEPQSIASFVH